MNNQELDVIFRALKALVGFEKARVDATIDNSKPDHKQKRKAMLLGVLHEDLEKYIKDLERQQLRG